MDGALDRIQNAEHSYRMVYQTSYSSSPFIGSISLPIYFHSKWWFRHEEIEKQYQGVWRHSMLVSFPRDNLSPFSTLSVQAFTLSIEPPYTLIPGINCLIFSFPPAWSLAESIRASRPVRLRNQLNKRTSTLVPSFRITSLSRPKTRRQIISKRASFIHKNTSIISEFSISAEMCQPDETR